MSLKEQLNADMKDAMRAKDRDRLGTIRMAIAAIKQKEIDEQTTLTDSDTLSVINKMIKQRRDAAKQYQDADRSELAEKELAEITVLEAYLPQQLSADAINTAVAQAINDAGAESIKDMGRVMAMLKSQLAGQADMGAVSQMVKQQLAG